MSSTTSQAEAGLGHSKLLVLLWVILETAGPSTSGVTGVLRPSNKSNETMRVVRPGSGSGAQTGLSHSPGVQPPGAEKQVGSRETRVCLSQEVFKSGRRRGSYTKSPRPLRPLSTLGFLDRASGILFAAPLRAHEPMMWIRVSSIQGVAQSSGSGVPDLSLNLDPPQRGCVTVSSLCYKVKQLC